MDPFDDSILGRFRELRAQSGSDAESWNRLAIALIHEHRLNEARAALERAIELEPISIAAISNLGAVLQMLGHADLAAESYRRALEIDPANAETHSNLAGALGALGEYDRALHHARRAIELKPEYVNPYVQAALAEVGRGAFDAALQWTDAVPAAARESAPVLIVRADILRQLHRFAEGLAACRRALALDPSSSDAYNSLGLLLQETASDDEAAAAFDRAVALAPDASLPLANKASMLMQCGRAGEARAAIEKAYTLDPNSAAVWYTRTMIRGFVLEDAEIATLEKLADPARTPSLADRVWLHFALGGAYVERSDADRAFRHLDAGNGMKRALVRYDADAAERRLDAIAAAFPAVRPAEAPATECISELPVFVVGMPRSGTTLIEQILASHPQVHGAGELRFLEAEVHRVENARGRSYPDFVPHLAPVDYAEIGRAYLAQIEPVPPNVVRVVDKMITNSLYAGLIYFALPRARIILCRRDPIDTCLSCYSKLFTSGLEYSYDLTELGRYYRAHDRLMAHWRNVLPAQNFLEIDYESVVADLEGSARRIVEFCGLEWSPACLRFHETRRTVRTASMVQVRKPLYRTSVGRWRQFSAHLAPLIEALSANPSLRSTSR